MGFAPTWLQHLNPPLHKITLTTEAQVFVPCPRAVASLEDAEGDQHLAGGHRGGWVKHWALRQLENLLASNHWGLEALLVTINDFKCILARSGSSFILELNRT